MTITTPKKNSVTITATDAKYLADAMLAAVSKDDITPVICAAQFEVTADGLRAAATDRYRAHTAIVDVEKRSGSHVILVPRETLSWLSKNALTFKGRGFSAFTPVVTFTSREPGPSDQGYLKIEIRKDRDASTEDGAVIHVGSLVKGNFPPVVEKLIVPQRSAEQTNEPFSLRPDYLASLRALGGGLHNYPLIKPTRSERPDKPGPVYFEFRMGGKVYAEAVIQPMILADGAVR